MRNLATRLGQVGAASLIEKPLAALALLPLDVPGEPALIRIPCQGLKGMGSLAGWTNSPLTYQAATSAQIVIAQLPLGELGKTMSPCHSTTSSC